MYSGGKKMKKPYLALSILLLVALLTSACEINMTSGSGKVITQNRSVSGFTSVTFAGIGELDITQGTSESLTVEAEDNIMPHITTTVSDGNLRIGFDQENFQNLIRPTHNIKFTLKVRSLNSIELSGLGSVNMPSLQADSLNLKVGGAGGIKIDKLAVGQLTSTMSGAGNLDLSGKATNQTITLSGLGNYGGGDLDSQQATISLTGAGNASVWARNSLNVKISGAGSVNYYGSPTITKSITGLGVINSMGSK
jgi:predicted small secreted protein